ncbi:MAG: DUF4432 family protein [Actinobacteria bacterium]|nr:DUF4432 family protein [Actinomycetota bacterium]
MENNETQILLNKDFFVYKEQKFIEIDGLKVFLFKYDTGVCAVKLVNENGYAIVLPFNGQQIWDIVFDNRRLKMKSPFTLPVNTNNFYYSYGCFFMHCGALRVGSPDSSDFSFHGELPTAEYDNVKILTGKDSKGTYLGVTGVFEYNKAFGSHYCAKSVIKFYKDSTLLEISIEIMNLSNYPMELMYLAHINFLPVENGEIMQSAGFNKENMILRNALYPDLGAAKKHVDFVKKISVNPSLTKFIKLSDPYDPGIIFYFNKLKTDSNKLVHFMQVHSDGSSDYVGYKPEELNHLTRWTVINKDFSAISIACPATCEADGYLKEKEKGNISVLREKSSRKFNMIAGYLNKSQTIDMKRKIEEIIKE